MNFFDAAILGPWIPCHEFRDYMDSEFQLLIDGTLSQCAKGSDMMMRPDDILVYISQFFPLKAGDIIFTGTPAGVTNISKGAIAQLRFGHYSYNVQWK